MLTVQLIMESGEQLVMKLPISASIYELKRELQSLLNIQEPLEISTSDATLADSVLLTEVAGLGNNEQIKPIVSCYEGNNFVCLIRFSLESGDIALPLVDNSVSNSSIEVEVKVEARVTWPKVETCLLRIFTLLERQNSDIKTEKWAVVSREYLPPTVTSICPNERVTIWMDADSADIIKKRFNCLKLCFWTIEFEFFD
ncbi:uncharacterized protein LOC111519007 [Drosophila willistoni]|uniref:uncharacterized protein LOC111519007 n=1 Tax=Drosophila willistoni TaxID=7260 RepID=UPI000C26D080|nr:uncharacterized protein LOC111519007 [Drosophila willistoni]